MQLDLDIDPRTEKLRRMHGALVKEFGGAIRPAEGRRDPMWTLVQGVIGARSKTAVSNANADRLIAHYRTWEKVSETDLCVLTRCLRTATFPSMAARRLKACLQHIIAKCGRASIDHLADLTTAEAMAWLETLPGVGRKISAGVMNTSRFNRKALVLDAGHLRVVRQVGLVPAKADTTRAFDALMPVLPPEWTAGDIDEHHLLGKRLAQTFCRPKQPDCAACPLRNDCAFG